MWKNSNDLLESIHEAHNRLKEKKTDAATAHAEARLLNAAVKTIAVTLEHARLTNRLREHGAALPMMSFEEHAGVSPRRKP